MKDFAALRTEGGHVMDNFVAERENGRTVRRVRSI